MECTKWQGRNLPTHYPQQPWEYIKENIYVNIPRDGFFVEIGATNGVAGSNCHFFESMWGWRGVCIEPNPVAYEELKKNRPNAINCAIGLENCTKTFCVCHDYTAALSCIVEYASEEHMNRIDTEIKTHGGSKEFIDIEVKTLETIIQEQEVSHINYLSVDVEGAEKKVLTSIDFDKVTIDVISAEHNEYDKENNFKELLANKGFRFDKKVCADCIFIRNGVLK